jgi:hypothetical protein
MNNLNDDLTKTVNMAQAMASMEDYFDNNHEEQLLWIQSVKKAAEAFRCVLLEGEYTLMDMTPLIVACDLCLKTYSAKYGPMNEAESLLLNLLPYRRPWRINVIQ